MSLASSAHREPRLVWLVTLALSCCGGTPSEHEHDEGAAAYEGCPASTPPFVLGMETLGRDGRIRARLRHAEPAPPARYRNDWEVEFLTPLGERAGDVSLVHARPFMPVHGHDGNVQPTLRALGDQVAIDYLNLNMRGPWEIQLTVSSPTLGNDEIVFHVCVAE